MQYEQYEQEVRDLQGLIEEAHRVIQDRPIPTNNIQELQAQILHHEVQNTVSLLTFFCSELVQFANQLLFHSSKATTLPHCMCQFCHGLL